MKQPLSYMCFLISAVDDLKVGKQVNKDPPPYFAIVYHGFVVEYGWLTWNIVGIHRASSYYVFFMRVLVTQGPSLTQPLPDVPDEE